MDLPVNKRIFSGLKPSGEMHIGNYIGAIKQWINLQEHNEAYYCVVDLHAITVPYDPQQLHSHTLDAAALYIALGLNPEKSTIFIQSHVPAHSELAWLLGTITPYGELARMTQFKDKHRVKGEAVSHGLFSYPVLMAADILLYQAQQVPVGEDQLQHLELARTIARRFNTLFSEILTVPEPYTQKSTARIMSLQDPTKKMSKSEEDKGSLLLLDSPDIIRKKIMSAVTETDPVFSFTKSGPAVKNLLAIYQAVTDQEESTIEQEFSGSGYKQFKEALAEAVIAHLQPIQERYKEIRADEDDLRIILGRGMHTANETAQRTLHQVKEVMGLI